LVAGIYSDLLLHSVGTAGSVMYYGSRLGPPPKDFDIVRSDEIRTPPLWGLADSAPYLHDGSAATIEAAILRHDQQAFQSAYYYQNDLDSKQRKQLSAFLHSLRAPGAAATKLMATQQSTNSTEASPRPATAGLKATTRFGL
jgi:CxxC motif-containing protein (DUF1111 family)